MLDDAKKATLRITEINEYMEDSTNCSFKNSVNKNNGTKLPKHKEINTQISEA